MSKLPEIQRKCFREMPRNLYTQIPEKKDMYGIAEYFSSIDKIKVSEDVMHSVKAKKRLTIPFNIYR